MGLEFVLFFMLLGWGIGFTINRLQLWRVRRAHMQKSLYDLAEELSPAEFGYVLDGKIGRKELVAELTMLKMRGYIDLKRQDSDFFRPVNISSSLDGLTPIQVGILKKIKRRSTTTYDLQEAFEKSVKESLAGKGWAPKTDPQIMIDRFVQKRLPNVGYVLAAAFGIIWLVTVLAGASAEATELVFKIAAAIVMGSLVLFSVILLLLLILFKNAGLLLAATPKYKQSWKDVRGVYDYLRISGMDIFTPDYDNLTLKGVDKLYPYVVAAGLDKKIVWLID